MSGRDSFISHFPMTDAMAVMTHRNKIRNNAVSSIAIDVMNDQQSLIKIPTIITFLLKFFPGSFAIGMRALKLIPLLSFGFSAAFNRTMFFLKSSLFSIFRDMDLGTTINTNATSSPQKNRCSAFSRTKSLILIGTTFFRKKRLVASFADFIGKIFGLCSEFLKTQVMAVKIFGSFVSDRIAAPTHTFWIHSPIIAPRG